MVKHCYQINISHNKRAAVVVGSDTSFGLLNQDDSDEKTAFKLLKEARIISWLGQRRSDKQADSPKGSKGADSILALYDGDGVERGAGYTNAIYPRYTTQERGCITGVAIHGQGADIATRKSA